MTKRKHHAVGFPALLGLLMLLLPAPGDATPPTYICLTGECHPSIAKEEYVHGPIGSGMCPLCHDSGRLADNIPGGHPQVRIGNATEQCLLCHEEVSALLQFESWIAKFRWLLLCHDSRSPAAGSG